MALDGALPLGLEPATQYPECVLQLAPGDQLTLLSDGVVEARTAESVPGSLPVSAPAA